MSSDLLNIALHPLQNRLNSGAPTCATRLFHGRGGLYPGLEWCAIDDFGTVILVTLFAEPPPEFLHRLERIAAGYAKSAYASGVDGIALQCRYLRGAPISWLTGKMPSEAWARRNHLRFKLRFDRQNVGYFLDMEPGRIWLAERAEGRNVLNLFAFTCAFSVVATDAGANSVVNVDMSRSALSEGRENHRTNGLNLDRVQFMGLDILKSWSRIRKAGPYDLVIVDPPSFQKGSFVATKDYAKVLRRLNELSKPQAEALLCLNAPELESDFLLQLMTECAPDWTFIERLPTSPEFADINPQRQLKLMHFRRD